MFSPKSNLRLIGAFAALLSLALAVSCKGFFVNPTITTLSVGPVSPTIYVGNVNNTVQMFAVGTFNDGSTSNNTPVSWAISTSSGSQSIATISASGLVTAESSGTGTVTATSNLLPSITGTQPITVSIACTSAPVITPTSGTLTPNQATISFTATCNAGQDITSVATWFSSNTAIATVSAGVVTAVATANADGTFFITASANGFTSTQVSITATGF
jgi:trimeric autotransporter adhesin